MASDLFRFWSQIGPKDFVHPADEPTFERLRGKHGFNLKCLPLNFAGPLRTAHVVLLYLSPGFAKRDLSDAKKRSWQLHYSNQRTGRTPLPGPDAAGYEWRKGRLAFLGDWEKHRDKIAVLNIGAYHSSTFVDHDVLASLPSSRVALDWAQSVLFPEAEAGNRVVI